MNPIRWPFGSPVAARLASIEQQLDLISSLITQGTKTIMADLTKLQALEASETTAIQGLISDLQAQVAALATANGNGDQAGVDAVVAQMQTNLDAANAALSANPAPVAPVAPAAS